VKRLITFAKDAPTTQLPSGGPSATIIDYICQEKGWLDDEEKELKVEHMMQLWQYFDKQKIEKHECHPLTMKLYLAKMMQLKKYSGDVEVKDLGKGYQDSILNHKTGELRKEWKKMNTFDQAIFLDLLCQDQTIKYLKDVSSRDMVESMVDEYFDKHILPEKMDPLLEQHTDIYTNLMEEGLAKKQKGNHLTQAQL